MNKERWKARNKPASLEARFQFPDFATMRLFLDDLAEQAESLNHHPNISFARDNHVSIVIYSTTAELNEVDLSLANAIDSANERTMEQNNH